MKYPYIGKTELGSIVLFHKESTGRVIKHVGSIPVGRVDGDWCEIDFKNITHEYLANTYGEVVSPEHAEFIIKLAELHGFNRAYTSPCENLSAFAFKGDKLYLYGLGLSDLTGLPPKKITIPLPPKQIQTATPEEEFEMEQIMKNAGDNLVLGCEDSKCDEWPKIGDEVLVYPNSRRLAEIKGKAVKVIGKCFHSDGSAIITVEHSSLGVFAVANGSWIKKPKTPEEEFRDELTQVLADSYTYVTEVVKCKSTFAHYAKDLMSKYNITKKPQ